MGAGGGKGAGGTVESLAAKPRPHLWGLAAAHVPKACDELPHCGIVGLPAVCSKCSTCFGALPQGEVGGAGPVKAFDFR